jgi:hypothetical protein
MTTILQKKWMTLTDLLKDKRSDILAVKQDE